MWRAAFVPLKENLPRRQRTEETMTSWRGCCSAHSRDEDEEEDERTKETEEKDVEAER